jgi:hypothetical protein
MNNSWIKSRLKIFATLVVAAVFRMCILYPAHGPRYSAANTNY